MAGLTRWRPGATRTGGVMGLTTEHDGPGRPAGPDRQVEGYETVPLLIAGTAGDANGNGMAVLRRCPARPSKRAVVYVHCLDDPFVPPDLAGWYTDRGFHFYAADLRTLGGGGPGAPDTGRAAGALGECFACLDAAVTHLRAADAIQTVVVSGHAAGALVAALWCHARRGSRPADALVLANPELHTGRRWRARARAVRANGCRRPSAAAAVGSPAQAGPRARDRLPGPGHVPSHAGPWAGRHRRPAPAEGPGCAGNSGDAGQPPGHHPAGRARHVADLGGRVARAGARARAAAKARPGRAGPLAQRLPVWADPRPVAVMGACYCTDTVIIGYPVAPLGSGGTGTAVCV
jgi:hypothetical protein